MSGTLRDIDLKDIITVFAGVRGTTGLYLFDQIADYVANTNVKAGKEKVLGTVKKFIGELLAGYLTPIQNITDLMAEFYPEMRIVKRAHLKNLLLVHLKKDLWTQTYLLLHQLLILLLMKKLENQKLHLYVKESPLR
jgi:hypothetical protein